MNEKIKRGDVVRLKSGGPKMTVGLTWKEIDNDCIRVHWISNGNLNTEVLFAEEVAVCK
jgi:uncharacterized protein YodC (DUF2158 family)